MTSNGAPRSAPAYSYSLTPAFAADGAAIQVAGSQAEHDGDWTGFASLPILAGDLFAVLLFDDPKRHAVFADDARPIGADVDPTAVGSLITTMSPVPM